MKKLTRRQFLGTGAAGLFAMKAAMDSAAAVRARFDAPIFFQYWVIREPAGNDLDGTLKLMREFGYDGLELCSPVGYGRFVKFETTDPVELRQRIDDAGLRCHSSHFTASEILGDNVHSAIELAGTLRLETLYIASANFNEGRATLDPWKQFADEANAAGEIVKEAGLRLGYHNHLIGPEIDGKPQYDHVMELLDPDLVTMQFQVVTIREGYDVIEYLNRYAGRFSALHLSDYDPEADEGAPLGSGSVDWPALFEAARKSDIADYGYIVEVETGDPFVGLAESYAYLDQLNL